MNGANRQTLDIYVYVTGNYTTRGAEHGMEGEGGTHGRIKMRYRSLNIGDVAKEELEKRRGRTVVLCESPQVVPAKLTIDSSMRENFPGRQSPKGCAEDDDEG